MLRAHERIAKEMADPALVRLHRKLERLSSVLTVMNTGAHPDDEANGMFAALRFGYGMRIVVACSTRGEGGQNAIGPERGAALGIVRTLEMEASARVIDADIHWLGHGPDDPVHDFGFSKSGEDTLARWGEDRIIERLVRAYRQERPDVVIPTFLDVPGQHGHHRAMTRAARVAIDRAADPSAYPHHFSEGLSPWRVSKFYLPAWSGGGGTYDDEVPPPRATLHVTAPGVDTATGAPFARIGEWSRMQHQTQGMGIWRENPPQSWSLHRLDQEVDESDIRDGFATVGALAGGANIPAEVASHLSAAQKAIDGTILAFPHRERIVEAALKAADHLEKALAACPETTCNEIGHRLTRKLRELDSVILEASGVQARAWAEPCVVSPGGKSVLHVALHAPELQASAEPVLSPAIAASRRKNESEILFDLSVSQDASFTKAYPPAYRTLGGNGDVTVAIRTTISGREVESIIDLEEGFRIAPAHSLVLEPEAIIINLQEKLATLAVKVRLDCDETGNVAFKAPQGWDIVGESGGARITPPDSLAAGLYTLAPLVEGQEAYRSTPIAYPHIGRTALVNREVLKVLALDVRRSPETRIGYVGGGNDRVGVWLSRLGFDVTELDGEALNKDLSRFTTIVIGIFAFGTRPDLAAATARLHRFVEDGGHLVTLYHRPSDGWDPQKTPPRPLIIGSPSLRWRVTDPNAPVTTLEPGHPLLTGPNKIDAGDWSGWDKERGLYFASSWDGAYKPLLAMNDQGENPLHGALVSGQIGKGRHTHVSLVLHHQLDKLVPGAFRLLANLVQPA
ncbi:PIG-L family deacetylase [Microvirga flavescens]|uniref:PIG-L family deacetylase n=1 Tax=Microvirga flavescens TaxID=2249811 RepID=UPI000DD9A465|nr:PIG-L deacetylase family protein [Microvirga flavescens]